MTYTIIDEHKPSRLSKFAANPMWILIANILLQGLAGFWFIFNSFAIQSSTKRQEIGWILAGFFGAAFLVGLLVLGIYWQLLPLAVLKIIKPYSGLIRTLIILVVSYRVYLYQVPAYLLAKSL